LVKAKESQTNTG